LNVRKRRLRISKGSIAKWLRSACARLNRHYIPTRYPNAFDRGAPAEQFFEDDARQALEDAAEVIRFAGGIIGSASGGEIGALPEGSPGEMGRGD